MSSSSEPEYRKKKTTKYLKKRKHKPLKQRNSSEHDAALANLQSEGNQEVHLVKTPGWCKLEGELAKTDSQLIYNNIYMELRSVREKFGDKPLIKFVNDRSEGMSGRSHDVQLMYKLQGYRAVAAMVGDWQAPKKELKSLVRSINVYNISHRNTVLAALNYMLFVYYVDKHKQGNACSCLQKAMSYLQADAPSLWTSRLFYRQAWMYSILAQQRPKLRQKYHKEALKFYRLARDHWMHVSSDCFYEPLVYTFDMVQLTLDFPTMIVLYSFQNSHIMLQQGSEVTLCDEDISEAEGMLSTIQLQVAKVDRHHQYVANEYISIASVCLSVRKAQLLLQSNDFTSAMTVVQKAMDVYSSWVRDYKGAFGSRYQYLPNLGGDLLTLLQNLEDAITMQKRLNDPLRQYDLVALQNFLQGYISTPLSDVTTASGLSHLSDENPESESTDNV